MVPNHGLRSFFCKVKKLMDSDLAPKIGDVTFTIKMKYLVKELGTNLAEKYKSYKNSKGSQSYTLCVITFALDIF